MALPNSTPPPTHSWKIQASRYVIDTAHLRIRADTVQLPNGLTVDEYFVRESRGYSIVFALTKEKQILLVRQYKHGIGQMVVELPAGGIDPDESPEACAVRELAEETGYTGKTPEFVGTFLTDPTGSNTCFHLFIIRNVERTGEQHLDATEQITVELKGLDELRMMVRDGRINVSPHVTSVLTILDRSAAGLITL